MCTVLLPTGDNPIAVNKYVTYHITSDHPTKLHLLITLYRMMISAFSTKSCKTPYLFTRNSLRTAEYILMSSDIAVLKHGGGERMEKVSWTDGVRNEEILHTIKEDRNILHTI